MRYGDAPSLPMRLLPHILLAYIALGLQRGLDGLLTTRTSGGGWGRFDLAYAAAAAIATMLPGSSAAMGALLVGLAHDLTAGEAVGARAVGYGLAGLLIGRVNPRSFPSFVAVACGGAFVASFAAYLLTLGRQTFVGMSLTGVMTAAITLALAWPLWKLRGRLAMNDRRM